MLWVSVRAFLDLFRKTAQAGRAQTISLFIILGLGPFGLHIFSICKIVVVLENVDNVRAKFRDSVVQDMVGE